MSVFILYSYDITWTIFEKCQNVPILFLLASYKAATKHNLLRWEAYHIIFRRKSSDKYLGLNSVSDEDSISLKNFVENAIMSILWC